ERGFGGADERRLADTERAAPVGAGLANGVEGEARREGEAEDEGAGASAVAEVGDVDLRVAISVLRVIGRRVAQIEREDGRGARGGRIDKKDERQGEDGEQVASDRHRIDGTSVGQCRGTLSRPHFPSERTTVPFDSVFRA